MMECEAHHEEAAQQTTAGDDTSLGGNLQEEVTVQSLPVGAGAIGVPGMGDELSAEHQSKLIVPGNSASSSVVTTDQMDASAEKEQTTPVPVRAPTSPDNCSQVVTSAGTDTINEKTVTAESEAPALSGSDSDGNESMPKHSLESGVPSASDVSEITASNSGGQVSQRLSPSVCELTTEGGDPEDNQTVECTDTSSQPALSDKTEISDEMKDQLQMTSNSSTQELLQRPSLCQEDTAAANTNDAHMISTLGTQPDSSTTVKIPEMLDPAAVASSDSETQCNAAKDGATMNIPPTEDATVCMERGTSEFQRNDEITHVASSPRNGSFQSDIADQSSQGTDLQIKMDNGSSLAVNTDIDKSSAIITSPSINVQNIEADIQDEPRIEEAISAETVDVTIDAECTPTEKVDSVPEPGHMQQNMDNKDNLDDMEENMEVEGYSAEQDVQKLSSGADNCEIMTTSHGGCAEDKMEVMNAEEDTCETTKDTLEANDRSPVVQSIAMTDPTLEDEMDVESMDSRSHPDVMETRASGAGTSSQEMKSENFQSDDIDEPLRGTGLQKDYSAPLDVDPDIENSSATNPSQTHFQNTEANSQAEPRIEEAISDNTEDATVDAAACSIPEKVDSIPETEQVEAGEDCKVSNEEESTDNVTRTDDDIEEDMEVEECSDEKVSSDGDNCEITSSTGTCIEQNIEVRNAKGDTAELPKDAHQMDAQSVDAKDQPNESETILLVSGVDSEESIHENKRPDDIDKPFEGTSLQKGSSLPLVVDTNIEKSSVTTPSVSILNPEADTPGETSIDEIIGANDVNVTTADAESSPQGEIENAPETEQEEQREGKEELIVTHEEDLMDNVVRTDAGYIGENMEVDECSDKQNLQKVTTPADVCEITTKSSVAHSKERIEAMNAEEDATTTTTKDGQEANDGSSDMQNTEVTDATSADQMDVESVDIGDQLDETENMASGTSTATEEIKQNPSGEKSGEPLNFTSPPIASIPENTNTSCVDSQENIPQDTGASDPDGDVKQTEGDVSSQTLEMQNSAENEGRCHVMEVPADERELPPVNSAEIRDETTLVEEQNSLTSKSAEPIPSMISTDQEGRANDVDIKHDFQCGQPETQNDIPIVVPLQEELISQQEITDEICHEVVEMPSFLIPEGDSSNESNKDAPAAPAATEQTGGAGTEHLMTTGDSELSIHSAPQHTANTDTAVQMTIQHSTSSVSTSAHATPEGLRDVAKPASDVSLQQKELTSEATVQAVAGHRCSGEGMKEIQSSTSIDKSTPVDSSCVEEETDGTQEDDLTDKVSSEPPVLSSEACKYQEMKRDTTASESMHFHSTTSAGADVPVVMDENMSGEVTITAAEVTAPGGHLDLGTEIQPDPPVLLPENETVISHTPGVVEASEECIHSPSEAVPELPCPEAERNSQSTDVEKEVQCSESADVTETLREGTGIVGTLEQSRETDVTITQTEPDSAEKVSRDQNLKDQHFRGDSQGVTGPEPSEQTWKDSTASINLVPEEEGQTKTAELTIDLDMDIPEADPGQLMETGSELKDSHVEQEAMDCSVSPSNIECGDANLANVPKEQQSVMEATSGAAEVPQLSGDVEHVKQDEQESSEALACYEAASDASEPDRTTENANDADLTQAQEKDGIKDGNKDGIAAEEECPPELTPLDVEPVGVDTKSVPDIMEYDSIPVLTLMGGEQPFDDCSSASGSENLMIDEVPSNQESGVSNTCEEVVHESERTITSDTDVNCDQSKKEEIHISESADDIDQEMKGFEQDHVKDIEVLSNMQTPPTATAYPSSNELGNPEVIVLQGSSTEVGERNIYEPTNLLSSDQGGIIVSKDPETARLGTLQEASCPQEPERICSDETSNAEGIMEMGDKNESEVTSSVVVTYSLEVEEKERSDGPPGMTEESQSDASGLTMPPSEITVQQCMDTNESENELKSPISESKAQGKILPDIEPCSNSEDSLKETESKKSAGKITTGTEDEMLTLQADRPVEDEVPGKREVSNQSDRECPSVVVASETSSRVTHATHIHPTGIDMEETGDESTTAELKDDVSHIKPNLKNTGLQDSKGSEVPLEERAQQVRRELMEVSKIIEQVSGNLAEKISEDFIKVPEMAKQKEVVGKDVRQENMSTEGTSEEGADQERQRSKLAEMQDVSNLQRTNEEVPTLPSTVDEAEPMEIDAECGNLMIAEDALEGKSESENTSDGKAVNTSATVSLQVGKTMSNDESVALQAEEITITTDETQLNEDGDKIAVKCSVLPSESLSIKHISESLPQADEDTATLILGEILKMSESMGPGGVKIGVTTDGSISQTTKEVQDGKQEGTTNDTDIKDEEAEASADSQDNILPESKDDILCQVIPAELPQDESFSSSVQEQDGGDKVEEMEMQSVCSQDDTQSETRHKPKKRLLAKTCRSGNCSCRYCTEAKRAKQAAAEEAEDNRIKRKPMPNKFKKLSISFTPTAKTVKCTTCVQVFENEQTMQEHFSSAHKNPPKVCSICRVKFETVELLEQHEALHTSNGTFLCLVCSRTYKQKAHIVRHCQSHSEKEREKATPSTSVSATPSTSAKSEASPSGKSPPVKSSKLPNVKVKNEQFPCTLCGKVFVQEHLLDMHKRVHAGELPYACTMCDKSFKQSNQLRKHERVHTGEKPYTCQYCNKTFYSSSNMRRHERTHTGVKPYKCRICDKRLSEKWILRKHEKSHLSIAGISFDD